MNIDQAVKELQALQAKGYGTAVLRNYSELANETYPPAKFVFHASADNPGTYDERYADWVEVA